jgi:hypothetical protein
VQVLAGNATLHANRIAGNHVGLSTAAAATVDAADNWWGSNAGPNGAGSDRALSTNGALLSVPSWLVLGMSVSPNPVSPGGQTTVTADLTHNNLGNAVTPALPPTPVLFLASGRRPINPGSTSLKNGTASATYTAGSSDGLVSATVDNKKVFAMVDVQ